ncbi:MCE family protein [Hoyosella altamirensis]|uniref:Phospholipid/cholesterol/gamma-HCH transport system substrate-binding protein n=1 Tax=Hoyosella altamirensis TaxID=616997 RepID=A0A839RQS4_9ACTN|nr:MCE family protein [Hoyosella altamirensis]MBB3039332.1 phospholipid/cholesterol/gamma-HCH transport system substrate-binding protein [Hoyosella altamirensis]
MVSTVRSTRSSVVRMVVLVLVIVLVFAIVWVAFLRDDRKLIVAEFMSASGVYPDSPVLVLGIEVGRVTSVQALGDHVRVEMMLDREVPIPDDAEAYIVNRSILADRYIELTPRYISGPEFPEGGTLPRTRTHVPIAFDDLLQSFNHLGEALSTGAGVGGAIDRVAASFDGIGPETNVMIQEMAAASRIAGAHTEEFDEIIAVLGDVARLVSDREQEIRSFAGSLAILSEQAVAEEANVAELMTSFRGFYEEIDLLIDQRGDDFPVVMEDIRLLIDAVAANPSQVADLVDLLPLIMENISNLIGDDGRARIRLNVASELQQLSGLQDQGVCGPVPPPICTGMGLTNPISLPISLSDPLGIRGILEAGGR